MKTRISLMAVLFSLGLASALLAQPAGTGALWVRAEAGTQVFLDAKLQGVATEELGGLVLPKVPAGSHSIKAIKTGFAAKTVTVSLKPGEARIVQVPKLVPAKGAAALPPPPTILYVFLPGTRLSLDIQLSLDKQGIGAISKTAPCVKREITAGDHAAIAELKAQPAQGRAGKLKKFASGAVAAPPAPPTTFNFRSAAEEKLFLKVETGSFQEDKLEMGLVPEAEAKNFIENCPEAKPPQPTTPEPAK